MTGRAAAATAVVLLAVGGCTSGGSHGAPPSTSAVAIPTPVATTTAPPPQLVACPGAARVAAARAAGRSAGRARVSADRSSGLTTCSYRMSVASGRPACGSATVRVDTGAQAYTDFHRWVDEQSQNASAGGPGTAPEQLTVPALGREVEWVPASQTLQVGRPGRWVTAAVRCGRSADALPLARRLAATVFG